VDSSNTESVGKKNKRGWVRSRLPGRGAGMSQMGCYVEVPGGAGKSRLEIPAGEGSKINSPADEGSLSIREFTGGWFCSLHWLEPPCPLPKRSMDNIQRLKLEVKVITPFHGNRTTDLAEVSRAAGVSTSN
jgi:hypothetical protein